MRQKPLLLMLFLSITIMCTAQNKVPNPNYTAPEGRPLKGWRICIDPGHGGQIWGSTRGYTGGTRSCVSNQSESDANLRVGLFLWDLLTQAGAEVVMTRTFETRLSEDCQANPQSEEYKANRREELNIRCRVAESTNSDFLVSIHHNAAGSDANYSIVYYYDPDQNGNTDVKHSPESVSMSKDLALKITEGFGEWLKLRTVSPRHGNYHVLRETSLPAVIVECAFMTNKDQAEWMENLEYSRLAAIGIFEGILDACKEKKSENKEAE